MKHKEEEVPLSTDGGMRQRTKPGFDQVLKMAMEQSQETDVKPGKKKKKKVKSSDPELLESLRNGIGIRKDEEDEAILKNTFDPDDVKGEKSNKRRERQMKQRTGIENEGYEYENEAEGTVKKKRKKKKPVEDSKNVEMVALEPEAKPEETEPSGLAEMPHGEKPKKKKKKKKVQEQEEIEMDDRNLLSDDGPQDESLGATAREYTAQLAEQEAQSEVKKKKKKKKKTLPEETEERIDARPEEEVPAAADEERPPTPLIDDGRILGVTIHRTDKLKTDFFVSHPLVRVHVLDAETGQFIKKLDKSKAVTAYYEKENENVDFILPIMTQPFDFKQKKSTLPVWEEMLVFNENFHYFNQQSTNTVLFFELLDFVSMNRAGVKYNLVKQDGGFHHVAWAFLKLRGATGKTNTDKKVRLQLFQPPERFRSKPGTPNVYQWWKSGPRMPYPSTLYVTAKGIIPPEKINPSTRSMFALQEEKGKATFDDLQRTLDQGTGAMEGTSKRTPSAWNRLPGQVCKVPNCLMLTLPSSRKGCFVVKFSHDGRSLACGCHDKDGYPILVYEIPSGRLKARILGHYGIIYELDWSKNDKRLVSASSDNTARIWDMETLSSIADKVMPHPSFVYTAKFHVKVNKVVVTGGYDQTIRVWSIQGESTTAQLMQELDGHMSFVNSLCFDTEGAKMFSADSLGTLRIWNVHVTDQPSKRGILRDWTLFKEIRDEEIKGAAINCVECHPSGRRVLVHCRDNTLRTIDLRVLAVSQRYIGALNFREQVRSTLTPCGTFVFSGSEDGAAYVWNFETGDQVARYAELNYRHPLTSVTFHPHDHMVAFCSFGENEPILIYRYNHRVAQMDAGLEPEATVGDLTGRTGRPGSPELNPRGTGVMDQSALGPEATHNLREDLKTQAATRMDRVKKKLDSVLAFQSLPTPAQLEHPMGVPGRATSPVPQSGTFLSTWGSTFDASGSAQRNLTGAMSPHASNAMSVPMQQQMLAQQQYMKQSHSGWRPGFMPVGRSGTVRGNVGHRPPELTMNMEGKPHFTIQEPTSARIPPATNMVVALYDYSAQRSDEISLVCGDVIMVVYKDNENWWLGRLPDGREGFFPANYVAEQGLEDVPVEQDYVRVLEQQEDLDEVDHKPTTVTAVKTKSGDLRFLSGAEDSDLDTPTKRRVRKKKVVQLEDERDPSAPRRTRKKKAVPVEESTA